MTTPPLLTTAEAINAVEAEFSTLFNRVRGAMRDYAAKLDPELTPVNYKILSTLDRSGPLHAGALAELLEMDKSVLSRHLAVLDRMRMVTRTPDPRDGRSSILAVTPDTGRRLTEIRSSNQAILHESLRRWPEGDVATLAELLHRINQLSL